MDNNKSPDSIILRFTDVDTSWLRSPLVPLERLNEWVHRHLDFPFKQGSIWSADGFGEIKSIFRVKNLSIDYVTPAEDQGMVSIHSFGPLRTIGLCATEKAIITGVFKVVGSFLIHEFFEGFKVDNHVILDPHDPTNYQAERIISSNLENVADRFVNIDTKDIAEQRRRR